MPGEILTTAWTDVYRQQLRDMLSDHVRANDLLRVGEAVSIGVRGRIRDADGAEVLKLAAVCNAIAITVGGKVQGRKIARDGDFPRVQQAIRVTVRQEFEESNAHVEVPQLDPAHALAIRIAFKLKRQQIQPRTIWIGW